MGVEEKASAKGRWSHPIVWDLERSTVEFVTEDRRTDSLGAYYPLRRTSGKGRKVSR